MLPKREETYLDLRYLLKQRTAEEPLGEAYIAGRTSLKSRNRLEAMPACLSVVAEHRTRRAEREVRERGKQKRWTDRRKKKKRSTIRQREQHKNTNRQVCMHMNTGKYQAQSNDSS